MVRLFASLWSRGPVRRGFCTNTPVLPVLTWAKPSPGIPFPRGSLNGWIELLPCFYACVSTSPPSLVQVRFPLVSPAVQSGFVFAKVNTIFSI